MFNSNTAIFSRILSASIFGQLCHLWQQMAENADQEVVLLGDSSFANSHNPGQPEQFRLLISSQFSTLLLGKPLVNNSETAKTQRQYQVTISSAASAIADFLSQLEQRFPDYPGLQQAQLLHNQDSNPNFSLQEQFIWSLLDILATPAQPLTEITSYSPSPAQSIEQILHQRLEQERILNEVSLHISQDLDLLIIVKVTIEQVQRLLHLDRLLVYQIDVKLPQQEQSIDLVTYETRVSEVLPSLLNYQEEICFRQHQCYQKYAEGFTFVVEDRESASELEPCLRSQMQKLQIYAKVVTPIIVKQKLWGLLIAHQCFAPRKWKANETKFLRHIAQYLAIAIEQGESYQNLQKQTQLLEQQVKQRAQELQEAITVAQAATQSKNEFLETMSHELRTPLTCIIGLSGTLLNDSLSDKTRILSLQKQQQYLQLIQESGRNLLELINNILDFSEIAAGKTVLHLQEFSLSQVAKSMLHNLSELAANKQINLQLDLKLASAAEDNFCADQQKLQQILFHLLSNALKFTPAGGTIILHIWREQEQAFLQVEDTGIGIPQRKIPLLFKKFQQLENPMKRTYKGTGLGLALIKQLVEIHRGKIEVESVVGQGSSFTVIIPNQYLPGASPKPTVITKASDNTGKTIILIENNEDVATLLCEMLNAAEYKVIWLVDSSISVKQVELLEPVIVMIDQEFSELNLQEFTHNIKQLKAPIIPKILLLIKPQLIHNWHYWQSIGIDSYLCKPIQPVELLEAVQKSIE